MFGAVDISFVTFVFMTLSIFALVAEVVVKRKENSKLKMELDNEVEIQNRFCETRKSCYFTLRRMLARRLEGYLTSGEVNPTVYYHVMSMLSHGGFVFMADLTEAELRELQDIVDENYQDLLEEYTQGEEE